MSVPILDLPSWVWLVYLDVTLWFLTVPAAIVLMLVGWYGAARLGGWRWVPFGAGALLAAPIPIAAAFIAAGEIRSAIIWAALQHTLDRDETVAGLALPAGSRIQFSDQAHSGVTSIELPHAADIGGMRVVGTLDWIQYGHVWTGRLVADQRVGGWPCRAGRVEFDAGGVVQTCELATAHELLGLALPPGTTVTRGSDATPWALRLPETAGLTVPALATTAPAGVTLSVASDGRLERITSGHGQTIVVRGVPLSSMSLYVRGDQVVAALAAPFMVAGAMQPAETGVRIDLPSGRVSLAGENWWLSQ